ncbi:MAG: undecaprenyl-diphosphate phosphatase [Clostridiales bacterium]|nr:undecaprenyl-diphosphate phosphatase [Clostridiales bacterium]
MNSNIEAALRGLIQGLTEFLPISSSGHLLLMNMLGLGQQTLLFDILLHVATLIVVVVIYRKSIISIIKNPLGYKAKFILIASIPTALLAALVRYFLYDYATKMLPFCFMLTSAMLFSTAFAQKENMALKWRNGYTKVAVLAGVFQGIATLSGVSRSGSVITCLRHAGLEKEESSEFTFLLSIPIIIGSALVEILFYKGGEKIVFTELFLGMIFALIGGFVAIKTFIRLLSKEKIWYFGIYTFLVSIVAFYMVFNSA